MKLKIVSEGGAEMEVGAEDAPQLFKAWKQWQLTEERTSEEAMRWDDVIAAAQEHVEDDGSTEETVDDVELVEDAKEFTLKIELGNAAMETPRDIAKALREAAGRLECVADDATSASAPIYDENGNRVGKWEMQ